MRRIEADGATWVLVECQNITKQKEAEFMLDSYSQMAERNARELTREKERVEKLLLNIMPKAVYNALRRTIVNSEPLDGSVADAVAKAAKEWAVEHGATHYTHWFQPLTGITAEKHDAFLNPTTDGKAVLERSAARYLKIIRGDGSYELQ